VPHAVHRCSTAAESFNTAQSGQLAVHDKFHDNCFLLFRTRFHPLGVIVALKKLAGFVEPYCRSLSKYSLGSMKTDRIPIAVLISGTGRTLQNFLRHIDSGRLQADVRLVISSHPDAAGLQFAHQADIPTLVAQRRTFASDEAFSEGVFDPCRRAGVQYVAMAGFIKFVPIPDDFAGHVVNIHPALIPAFCGRGLYGRRVHEAVLQYGARISGCTVHFVDNQYDHGPIILQRAVPVLDDDTPETLADRVFEAELEAYPTVLNLLAAGRVVLDGRHVRIADGGETHSRSS